jgi:hypothetical protein
MAGFIPAALDYAVRQREMSIKMIEIAVGILTAKPDDSIRPARKWAVQVISKYAADMEVPIDEDVRRALYDNPLPTVGGHIRFSGALGDAPLGAVPLGAGVPVNDLSLAVNESELDIEIRGSDVIVTLPGTAARAVYKRSPDKAGLTVASLVGEPRFRKAAWWVVNVKARELNWIAPISADYTRSWIRDDYGKRLLRIVLCGSRARGESRK